jgi:hypothetical protein
MIKITRKRPEYVYYIHTEDGRYFGPLTRKQRFSKKHKLIKFKLEEI